MFHYDKFDQSIVIDGFEKGVADNPFDGISDCRNLDITSVPGEASVAFSTSALTQPPTVVGLSFSVSAATDVLTVSATTNWYNGMAITLASLMGGTGLVISRPYWVGDLTPTTFKLYKNPSRNAGSLVNVTLDGSGNLDSYTFGRPIDSTFDFDTYTTTSPILEYYFILDTNGRVWWIDDTGGSLTNNLIYIGNEQTLTGTTGRGIQVFNGYLIVFRTTSMDALLTNLLASGTDLFSASGWIFGWSSVNSSAYTPRPTLVGQDNGLYFGNSGQLGSVLKVPGATFDPTNITTWTYAVNALDLPAGDDVVSLAELGVNLLVGGIRNYIYPWDRVSTSFTYPILLAESNVQKMVTVNTNTYIFVGNRGRIYLTNGSQAQLYKKVPDHISGTVEPYFTWKCAGFNRNNLVFGFAAGTNAGGSNSQYGGLWAIDLDTNAIRLLNQLSYATYAGSPTTILRRIGNVPGFGLYIGWDSGASTFGVDQTSSTPYTGSQATIDSDLIPIGTFEKPRNATRVEYRLTRPLVSGESITIKTRLIFDTTDTGYTTTLTDSAVGAYSNSSPVNFSNAQWVQLQAVLTSTASSPSYVRLKEIRLKGLVP